MQQCLIINMLRPAISSLVHLDVQLAPLLCPPVTDKTKWSRLQVGIVSQDLNKAGPQTTGSQRLAAESTSECNRRQTVFKTRGRTLSHSPNEGEEIFLVLRTDREDEREQAGGPSVDPQPTASACVWYELHEDYGRWESKASEMWPAGY